MDQLWIVVTILTKCYVIFDCPPNDWAPRPPPSSSPSHWRFPHYEVGRRCRLLDPDPTPFIYSIQLKRLSIVKFGCYKSFFILYNWNPDKKVRYFLQCFYCVPVLVARFFIVSFLFVSQHFDSSEFFSEFKVRTKPVWKYNIFCLKTNLFTTFSLK